MHHGYMESAKAFARWSTLASTPPGTNGPNSSNSTDPSTSNDDTPGLQSMLHRRRLRTLCLRCQYGKAAHMLTKLYPAIVERYPELLVPLRCRQLVEMARSSSLKISILVTDLIVMMHYILAAPTFHASKSVGRKHEKAHFQASCPKWIK